MDQTVIGAGCGSTCLEEHKLLMNADNTFQWEADWLNKTNSYVCQSKCPRFYRWFPKMLKCLKVYEEPK